MNILEYKKKSTETVLTISVVFIIVVGINYLKNSEILIWPFFVSGILLFFGLLVKRLGLLITITWFKLSQTLGWISSKVILSVLYFFIITPYAFLWRLFSRRDVLNRKPRESLFITRDKKFLSTDLKNPW